MTWASGIGSHPGDDQDAFDTAVGVVLDTVPDLAYVPEVPGRGAGADMIGRTLSLLVGLGVDLQPAGWRLTDASGIDHRRAQSLLAQDLDGFEERSQGYEGRLKVQVTGPWTLASVVERPRGDRLLADVGARRELAQSLAEGIRVHLADVRRRVPGVDLLVQIDEPALPSVLAGAIPTASGFHRHRSVDAPLAAPPLEWLFQAVRESGAEPVVHCCAADAPLDLLEKAGAPGISLDLDRIVADEYDGLAAAIDAGHWVFLGVVPPLRPSVLPTETSVTERVLRVLDILGVEPSEWLVLTPGCGLAGADPQWARTALSLCQAASKNL